MQDLVHIDGHDHVVIKPKPLPTGMLRISSVMPPGWAAPMMSDGCNELIFSTLHSMNDEMLDRLIEVYQRNNCSCYGVHLILSVSRAHKLTSCALQHTNVVGKGCRDLKKKLKDTNPTCRWI